jgi:hypothetical protein
VNVSGRAGAIRRQHRGGDVTAVARAPILLSDTAKWIFPSASPGPAH